MSANTQELIDFLAQVRRSVRQQRREMRISVVLPAEELLQTPQPPAPLDMVEGLLDVAASYLDNVGSEPSDDHTLVMVHVSAESLDVPAGTPENVPAGTSDDESTPTSAAPASSGVVF